MSRAEYDPHNDRFVRELVCPHPGCGADTPAAPKDSPTVYLCPACERPYEVVRLPISDDVGGASPWTARRARSAWCTRSGQPLLAGSVLDYAGAGGGGHRASSIFDSEGHIFGAPSRDVEWSLERGWSQERWGTEDRARPEEQLTSLAVVRGVVVAVSAAGRVGLFNLDDGVPLLKRPLELSNAGIDETDPTRALRMPPAFAGGRMVALTDRVAVFRDLSASLFPGAAPAGDVHAVSPSPGAQWIGPPLFAGDPPLAILVEGQPRGPHAPPDEIVARGFTPAGVEVFALPLPGAVRPLVHDETHNRLHTATELGHLMSFSAEPGPELHRALPAQMLKLATTDRPHLVVADSASGAPELWLADDRRGAVRVWRTDLARALSPNVDWSWEVLFEDPSLGQLRGFSVGHGGRDPRNLQAQYFVLASEKAAAAYSRAVRSPSSDAVLPKAALGPPVLTSLGYFLQDRGALWCRGFAPWSWRDDNPVRRVEPLHPEVRAPFYDRTLAVYGRQVFFGAGGLVTCARAVHRPRERS